MSEPPAIVLNIPLSHPLVAAAVPSVTDAPVVPRTTGSLATKESARQFRKGPLLEQAGLTVYAKCVGDFISTDLLESDGLLGCQVRRLRPKSSRVVHARLFKTVDVFIFDFGSVCCWGCSRPQLARVLEALSPYVEGVLERPTEDRASYCPAELRQPEDDSFKYTDQNDTRQRPDDSPTGTIAASQLEEPSRYLSCIIGDTIYLSTSSSIERLAYSYGLAQGVKLDVFEQALAETIDAIGDLPAELAEKGEAQFSMSQAGVRLGEIFLLQYEVNLRSDLLESPPDTFWDLDIVAPVYRLGRSHLDLDHRLNVLNKRLKFLKNMYTMLQAEAEVRASNTLGWIITWGVAGEVLVASLQMALMIWNYNQ